ncbi:hypothetical protein MACH09_25770 [Vibrio sp. MACH09]|uniref:zinc uptake protein ZrgA n=1 Tax=Vibrio sp. MACH09 TaxID=3025122 RepID=UPI0027922D17|nr:DUF2796 domain-containing protein [Vibrio sp. MACH09]GLO62069.1 hypothetical protein MACH09_25770 [Vibrio sp. MACH09]
MHHSFKLSLISCLILSAPVMAEESFRQHDAHLHGHVELNIAQDGNELLVEITAPGSDIVGFEHAPENEAQHQQIENAEAQLAKATEVLMLPASAQCQVEHVSIKNTLESHDSHDEHAHDEDDHDHDHDKHDHDKHDHDKHDHDDHKSHSDESDKKGGHGEFAVEYHFECAQISKITEIKTQWFELFPNTEEITVNLLTDTAQTTMDLTSKQPVIKL